MKWILLVASGTILVIARLILEKEYDAWAPRLATALLRLAALFVPGKARDRHLREWLADLEGEHSSGQSGLTHALSVLLIGAPRIGFVESRKHSSRRKVATGLELEVAHLVGATRPKMKLIAVLSAIRRGAAWVGWAASSVLVPLRALFRNHGLPASEIHDHDAAFWADDATKSTSRRPPDSTETDGTGR